MEGDRVVINLRRATSANWRIKNPVLAPGEPGYERDTGKFKIGDGQSRWSDLDYYLPESSLIPHITDLILNGGVTADVTMQDHIHAEEPHPAYDDGPSLFLLYENAKV